MFNSHTTILLPGHADEFDNCDFACKIAYAYDTYYGYTINQFGQLSRAPYWIINGEKAWLRQFYCTKDVNTTVVCLTNVLEPFSVKFISVDDLTSISCNFNINYYSTSVVSGHPFNFTNRVGQYVRFTCDPKPDGYLPYYSTGPD